MLNETFSVIFKHRERAHCDKNSLFCPQNIIFSNLQKCKQTAEFVSKCIFIKIDFLEFYHNVQKLIFFRDERWNGLRNKRSAKGKRCHK